MIIYLNPAFAGPPEVLAHLMMRRYPRIQRTGCPPSVLSCTAWGFSCLANYFASGELLPRLFTLACASFKEPAVSFLWHFPSPQFFNCGARVFYAACCRMVFGLSSSEPCDSPAIICHRRTT